VGGVSVDDRMQWLAPVPVACAGMRVGAVRALPAARLDELRALYALLDPALPALRCDGAEAAVRAAGVTLFAAADEASGGMAGVATLVTARTPARVRAWAEDLVVDPRFRGRGIGAALMDACAAAAGAAGAEVMDGTVHPRREAAVALYRRTGWEFSESLPVRRRL